MHRASLNRLVPALLLLAAAGCNNDPVDPDIGTCEAALDLAGVDAAEQRAVDGGVGGDEALQQRGEGDGGLFG